jgi:hypothetical protein
MQPSRFELNHFNLKILSRQEAASWLTKIGDEPVFLFTYLFNAIYAK